MWWLWVKYYHTLQGRYLRSSVIIRRQAVITIIKTTSSSSAARIIFRFIPGKCPSHWSMQCTGGLRVLPHSLSTGGMQRWLILAWSQRKHFPGKSCWMCGCWRCQSKNDYDCLSPWQWPVVHLRERGLTWGRCDENRD